MFAWIGKAKLEKGRERLFDPTTAHEKAGQSRTGDEFHRMAQFLRFSASIMELILKKGDRVRVATNHQWLPRRYGTIKHVETRAGNCFLVKFDRDELGMWHDEDGDPVLRLGQKDLILVDVGSVNPTPVMTQLIHQPQKSTRS